MSLGFQLAMPVGATFAAYSHALKKSLGEVTVATHSSIGVELYWHSIENKGTLPYPMATHWKLDGDHIRIAGANGSTWVTFAPV